MSTDPLQFLLDRRSVPSRQLSDPGPTPKQLSDLVEAATRVPDHGRLAPWRLIGISGGQRGALGEALAAIHRARDPGANEAVFEKDRQRFNHAPVVLTVVARLTVPHKVPEIEQMLSAGCVAYNLLLGAQAMGFGAQWLTGWAAYDDEVQRLLGLQRDERIVAFVHIGSADAAVEERASFASNSLLSYWTARSGE